jgi:hypothetical protein
VTSLVYTVASKTLVRIGSHKNSYTCHKKQYVL